VYGTADGGGGTIPNPTAQNLEASAGPLATADRRALAGHDPVRLARRESARLRADGVSFFLSTGFNHGGVMRRWTFEFARELRSLGLATRLWASPRPDGGRYLRVQLPAALEFAFRR
jgi:hypothetical protein